MNKRRPPQTGLRFGDLPTNPKERHEALLDVFGQHLFWLRDQAVCATRELGESESMRQQLASIWRGLYDELAAIACGRRSQSRCW